MAAFSSSDGGGGSSVITSGVRRIGAWIEIGGQFIVIEKGGAVQNAKNESSQFHAAFGLDGLPSGIDESFLANTTPMPAKIHVSTQANGGDRTVLVDGNIIDVGIDYLSRTVIVEGQDKASDLHNTKTSEKFTNQKPSDIVSTIASRVGLTAVVDASSLLAGKLFQIDFAKMTDGISLAGLMHKLAEFDGAHWFVQGDKLMFKKAGSGSGSYVVTYTPPVGGGPSSGDFLRLTVKRNVPLSQDLAVTVDSWHTKHKAAYKSTKVMKGNGGSIRYGYKTQELTKDRTDQHAASKAADHARHELTLSVEMAGDPTINVSQKLRLRGTAFAQDYDIDSIHHEFGFGSGYTMTIEARSAKSGRSVSDGTDSGEGAGDE